MDSPPRVKVEFDLTFGEMYRASFRIAVFVLRYLILLVGLAVLTFLVLLLIYNSNSPWGNSAEAVDAWLYPYLVGAVPTLVVLVPLVTLVRVWMIRRTPGLSGRRRYTFSDEGITIESTEATSELKWAFYARVKETNAFFLMYVTGSFCNVVPKRCFADSVQLEAFRALVRAHSQKFSLKKQ